MKRGGTRSLARRETASLYQERQCVRQRPGRPPRTGVEQRRDGRQLLFQLAQMEPGRQIRMCQQDTSGPETVCILRGKLAQKPASAHPSPTGIRQAGRRIALQGALHIQRGNRTGRHSIYELFDRQYDLYGPEWKEDGEKR